MHRQTWHSVSAPQQPTCESPASNKHLVPTGPRFQRPEAAGSLAGSQAAGNIEHDLWLCPLEDRRRKGSRREGMLEGFSLGSYLLLVDYSSRLCRQGKARISKEVISILDRLGTTAEIWSQRITRLFSKQRLSGSYFATDPARLRELAHQRGRHHLDNLVGAGGG